MPGGTTNVYRSHTSASNKTHVTSKGAGQQPGDKKWQGKGKGKGKGQGKGQGKGKGREGFGGGRDNLGKG